MLFVDQEFLLEGLIVNFFNIINSKEYVDPTMDTDEMMKGFVYLICFNCYIFRYSVFTNTNTVYMHDWCL